MNNIIRREPIYRKNLDTNDTKLVSINNFKGLQIFDNPLLADTNSTYMCKNIYRDEVGNLTVRPRMVPNNEKIYSGDIKEVRTFKSGTFKYSNNLVTGPNNNTLEIDEDTNVLFQEFENTVYVLVTQYNQLTLYKYFNDEFVSVEGDIPLVDPSNLDITSYNILNNKINTREYFILKPYPNISSEDIFKNNTETMFEYPRDFYGYHMRPGPRSSLLSNDIFITAQRNFNDNGTLKTVIYKYIYNRDTNNYTTETYVLDTNFEYTRVYDDNNKVLNDIGIFDKDTHAILVGYEHSCDIISGQFRHNIKAYKIVIPYDNTPMNTITRTYDSDDLMNDGLSKITVINEDIAFVKIFENGPLVDIGFTLLDFNEISSNSLGKLSYRRYTDDDFAPLEVFNIRYSNKNLFVDVWGSTSTLDTSKGLSELFSYSGKSRTLIKSFDWFRDEDNIWQSGYADIKTSPDLFLLKELDDIEYTIYNGVNQTKFNIQGIDIQSFNLRYVNDCFCFTNGNMVYTISKNLQNIFLYTIEPMVNHTTHQIFTNLNGTIMLSYHRQIDRDDKLVIKKREIFYEENIETRETDKIPCIDEIEDEPITNFYLDNTYWFVTQHHIFGTGASKGKLTIEFWDPLKYFKITEEITGAIRISDTSFWVFHKNGAYLIYKTTETLDDTVYTYWLITNTAKSKGCDFTNALTTLPISNNIATVTNMDICIVQMRKYIQSDERTLVPITLTITPFIQELLENASTIKVGSYKYLTLFCFNNKDENGITPILVYDNQQEQWYYWEFPVDCINQIIETENNIELLCKYNFDNEPRTQIFTLSTDYFEYQNNHIIYDIYCDKIQRISDVPVIDTFEQIEWFWESAIQSFKTTEYRKQLLFTNFILTDYNERVILNNGGVVMKEVEVNFDYYFSIYSQNYTEKSAKSIMMSINRVKNLIERTNFSNFSYLQILLKNQTTDSDDLGDKLSLFNKPKFTGMNLKYRLLSGVMT